MKQNFKVAQKDKMVFNDKVNELEAMVQLIEDYIVELKTHENKWTKECAAVSS